MVTPKIKIRITGNNTTVRLLALSLLKQKLHHVSIIECQQDAINTHQSKHDARCLALTPATISMFQNLNLWSSLKEHACPTTTMNIFTNNPITQNATKALHFDANSSQEPLAYILPYPEIIKTIASELMIHKKHIQLYDLSSEKNPNTHNETTITIHTDRQPNKQQNEKKLHNTDNVLQYFIKNETAITTILMLKKHHDNKAYQNFLPTGPIALLPLMNNQMSLIWSFREKSYQNHIMDFNKKDFLNRVSQHFNMPFDYFSDCKTIQNFDLKRHIRPYLQNDHTILLGEVAHALHPLAGQNFNLTVKDIAELTVHITKAARLGLLSTPTLFLADYAKKRSADTLSFFLLTEALNVAFSQKSTTAQSLARLALNIIDHTPETKDVFINKATGRAHNRLLHNLPL